MTTSHKAAARKRAKAALAAGRGEDPPSAWRQDLFARLETEIDRLRPLPEARTALLLMGEKAIILRDGPAMQGFVIVGENQQPRTLLRDGRDMPFRLADLAADLRERFPMLFEPATSVEEATTEPRAAAERDWLHVQADQPDPGVKPVMQPRPSAAGQGGEPSGTGSGAEVGLDIGSGTSELLPRSTGFRPTFLVYAGLLLLAGAVLAYAVSGNRGRPDALPPLQSSPAPAPSGQVPSGQGAPVVAPEAAKPASPASATERSSVYSGVPEVIDTATLRVDRKIVRLFGLEWQKGANAEDLTRYIASRPITCEPVPDTDKHRCRIEGRDLSEVVLYNGGGRATSEASPELKAAEEAARLNGFGVWQKR